MGLLGYAMHVRGLAVWNTPAADRTMLVQLVRMAGRKRVRWDGTAGRADDICTFMQPASSLPHLKRAYLDELLLQTHTHTLAHTHTPICNCHPRRLDCSIARLPFSLTCLTRTSHLME